MDVGTDPHGALPAKGWTTPEWLHFLRLCRQTSSKAHGGTGPRVQTDAVGELRNSRGLAVDVDPQRLSAGLSQVGHDSSMEVGRRKYIKPLYQELAKTPKARSTRKAVYAKAARDIIRSLWQRSTIC